MHPGQECDRSGSAGAEYFALALAVVATAGLEDTLIVTGFSHVGVEDGSSEIVLEYHYRHAWFDAPDSRLVISVDSLEEWSMRMDELLEREADERATRKPSTRP